MWDYNFIASVKSFVSISQVTSFSTKIQKNFLQCLCGGQQHLIWSGQEQIQKGYD